MMPMLSGAGITFSSYQDTKKSRFSYGSGYRKQGLQTKLVERPVWVLLSVLFKNQLIIYHLGFCVMAVLPFISVSGIGQR